MAENGSRNMLESNQQRPCRYPNKKEGTVLTAYSNAKAEVWRSAREELLSEGLTSANIERHKHALKSTYVSWMVKGFLTRQVRTEGCCYNRTGETRRVLWVSDVSDTMTLLHSFGITNVILPLCPTHVLPVTYQERVPGAKVNGRLVSALELKTCVFYAFC